YEALSYTWSTPTERSVITLSNNNNFQIPARLEAALQDLRMRDDLLVIWIDAICINQRNIEERNAQVQLMRRIYQQAIYVRIWLDMDISVDDPAIIKLQTLTAESAIEDLGSKPFFWAPVNKILENPYWKRVWIQQEITNASSLVL
ncbi:heterokaryon incompatibility, partial [Hyaloscypha variabilis F]